METKTCVCGSTKHFSKEVELEDDLPGYGPITGSTIYCPVREVIKLAVAGAVAAFILFMAFTT